MKNSVQDFFSHTTEPIEEAATKPSHNNIAKATEPETLMVVVRNMVRPRAKNITKFAMKWMIIGLAIFLKLALTWSSFIPIKVIHCLPNKILEYHAIPIIIAAIADKRMAQMFTLLIMVLSYCIDFINN
jgi:hypothetical protein